MLCLPMPVVTWACHCPREARTAKVSVEEAGRWTGNMHVRRHIPGRYAKCGKLRTNLSRWYSKGTWNGGYKSLGLSLLIRHTRNSPKSSRTAHWLGEESPSYRKCIQAIEDPSHLIKNMPRPSKTSSSCCQGLESPLLAVKSQSKTYRMSRTHPNLMPSIGPKTVAGC